MKETIDCFERESALDIQRSVIVQAPAGSGKTELLCRRFLTALLQVEYPEQVLAITFTRKAANEMQERIMRHLQEAKTPLAKEVLAHDEKKGWHLLDHPERLSMMTIDGLCSRIVDAAPLSSKLYGYRISDMPSLLYKDAAALLLSEVDRPHPWSSSLHQFLLHFGNQWQKVQDVLVEMLSKREQWMPLLTASRNVAVWRSELEKNLQSCVLEAMQKMDQHFSSSMKAELLELMLFAAEHLKQNFSYSTWPSVVLSHESFFRQLAHLLLTKEGTVRKSVDKRSGFPVGEGDQKKIFQEKKQQMLAVLEFCASNPALCEDLIFLKSAPPPHYTDEQWSRVMMILEVLQALVVYWQLITSQRKEVDFTEVALQALALLRDEDISSEVALQLDERLQHMLVDEFQDTSLLHYRLLWQLTQSWQEGDGRTVFFVGDPLQSIYRFRQAEVGLFLRAWEKGFEQMALMPLQLKQNFRSQAKLVEFYNTTLANILPKVSRMDQGAIAYTAVSAWHASLEGIAVDASGIQEEDYAEKLISDISHIYKNYPESKNALLVHSRSHLEKILPALYAAGIPCQTNDLTSLAVQPVVIDLMTWLNALLNLEDRLSWLSMLRAPWLEIPLVLLQELFEQETGCVWARLLSLKEDLLYATHPALERMLNLWQEALQQRQRQPLHQLLKQLWQASGAKKYWSNSISAEAEKQFWQYLQTHQQSGELKDMSVFKASLLQVPFTPSHKEAFLEIMTIHKAKGLEFDFVFLPALEKATQRDDLPLLVFDEVILSEGQKFLLAPLRAMGETQEPIFDFIWGLQKAKARQERLRLWYVACTRAKKGMYFYATLSEKNTRGSFAEALLGAYGEGE